MIMTNTPVQTEQVDFVERKTSPVRQFLMRMLQTQDTVAGAIEDRSHDLDPSQLPLSLRRPEHEQD